MGAAKIRLRLYAGLNEWALDSLFAPRPGALATCTKQYGLRGKDCEALLAASGRMSPAEASRLGAGAPIMTAAARPAAPRRTVAPAAPAQQQQSRFGSYDSGFRGGAQYPTQPQYGARPAPAYGAHPGYGAPPGYGAQAQPRYGAQPGYGAPQPGYGYARPMPARPMPAARPMPVARPMPARPIAAPPPSPAMVANRKAEYARKRQEYLERKKSEMEARKTKIVATAGGTAPVQRGPTSAAEAEAVGLDPSAVAKAPPASAASKPGTKAAASKSAPAAAAAEPEEVAAAEPAEPAKGEKPALDGDFLDGLMDNPLGKK
jgi:hypothetical protein